MLATALVDDVLAITLVSISVALTGATEVIGLARGLFDDQVFPSLLLAILVSTLVTPPLVRLVFRGVVPDESEAEPSAEPEPASGGR